MDPEGTTAPNSTAPSLVDDDKVADEPYNPAKNAGYVGWWWVRRYGCGWWGWGRGFTSCQSC